jgi:hypothetical protein
MYNAGEKRECVQEEMAERSEEESVTSNITSLLFSSPKLKGPKYVQLPPYLMDVQLLTKKLGKTCQRWLLIRVYRIQDCMMNVDEEEEEILDIPPPLDVDDTNDLEWESEKSVRSLREASALVQRIHGGGGFAIPPPSSEEDAATVTSHGSTKSYLQSFGDVLTSPIRYLSSPTPTYSDRHSRGKVSRAELMSNELLRKCRPSPSVGSATLNAAGKSCGVFPSLSREDSPYVKAPWVFLRECIRELDQRCLSYR